jgi:predicted RNase H-like HicB family nuclease
VTTAPSLEDARRLIAEAIEFHIEGMRPILNLVEAAGFRVLQLDKGYMPGPSQ